MNTKRSPSSGHRSCLHYRNATASYSYCYCLSSISFIKYLTFSSKPAEKVNKVNILWLSAQNSRGPCHDAGVPVGGAPPL